MTCTEFLAAAARVKLRLPSLQERTRILPLLCLCDRDTADDVSSSLFESEQEELDEDEERNDFFDNISRGFRLGLAGIPAYSDGVQRISYGEDILRAYEQRFSAYRNRRGER